MLLDGLALAGGASYVLASTAPQYSLGLWKTASLIFFAYFFTIQIWRVILYPRFFSPLRHLPHAPDGHWLWDQTGRILKEPSGIPMRDWVDNVPNDGLITYSTWFEQRVLVANPKGLAEVLVTKNYDFTKPKQFSQSLGRVLGLGILFAEGDEHKRQRKNLMPAFAFRHIKDLYPTFWKKSGEMARALSETINAKSSPSTASKETADADDKVKHAPGAIEVYDWSSRATLDIIGVSGMDRDFNSLQDPTNKLNQTYKSVFNPGRVGNLLRLVGIFVPISLLRLLPLKRNAVIRDAVSYIKSVCRDLIVEKRERLSTEKKASKADIDIISVALESDAFSDDDLVNQMMTFLLAGHETTATAMAWALYVLCKHPDIQTKLRKEIQSKLPSLDDDITATDIDNCSYLQAFCNEVLRVWAPVALTMRVAAKDTSILGQFIPKGTIIILCPWAVNMSEQLWGADAKEFKPERWLDAEGRTNKSGSADSNFSFLTFLHGPRSCIGQKFAQAEFACLIAAWVGSFETRFEDGGALASGETPDIAGGVTSKPKGGLWVQLKEVEKQ
ncbi:cytochrome P450 78A3 [Pochonia chlamydosporia 170]|uniref:Cytochrome P450 78A3 n=1 Tax=Pochonia chlamydosporia 170 TaxID=1380566 RepID=A0A179F2S0_METCM|nr:cytochrome P450 78A3 [Pochonia chlamydosporia 170]OAQ59681.1 cytochrome P450 78A3 [Pochonia chlamydosporia 170]